jgi:hypothetical protein
MINKIDVVFVHTKQFSKTVQWYKDIMGLNAGYGDTHWPECTLKEGTIFSMDAVGENVAGFLFRSLIHNFNRCFCQT